MVKGIQRVTSLMSRKPRDAPAKQWVATMHVDTAFSPDEYAQWVKEQVGPTWFECAAWALEKGEESGNDDTQGWHLQWTIHLRTKLRLSSVAQLPIFLPENGGSWPHLEKTADPLASWKYCTGQDGSKAGVALWWSYGEFQGDGAPRQLDTAINMVMEGHSMRDVALRAPKAWVHWHRGLESLRHVTTLDDDAPREVILHLGRTRTGKTYFAKHRYIFERRWVSPCGGAFWFPNYDGQDHAVLDEYRGQWPLLDLLRITGDGCESVPTKGGFTFWRPARVVITSQYHPGTWYDYTDRIDSYEAFLARVTSVVYFRHPRAADYSHLSVVHRGTPEFDEFLNVQPRIAKFVRE